jgi:hypothetical protein
MQNVKETTPWYNYVPTKEISNLSTKQEQKFSKLIVANSKVLEHWQQPQVPHPLVSQLLTTWWLHLDYNFHLENVRDSLKKQLEFNQGLMLLVREDQAAKLKEFNTIHLAMLKLVNDSILLDVRLYTKR